jgi:hypothetical protein
MGLPSSGARRRPALSGRRCLRRAGCSGDWLRHRRARLLVSPFCPALTTKRTCACCDHENPLLECLLGDGTPQPAFASLRFITRRSGLCDRRCCATNLMRVGVSAYGKQAQNAIYYPGRNRGGDTCWPAGLQRADVPTASRGSNRCSPPVRGPCCRSGSHGGIGHQGLGRPSRAMRGRSRTFG